MPTSSYSGEGNILSMKKKTQQKKPNQNKNKEQTTPEAAHPQNYYFYKYLQLKPTSRPGARIKATSQM